MPILKDRSSLLRAVEMPEHLKILWEEADILDWRSSKKPRVQPQDIYFILKRYLESDLSAIEVEDWANFMEATDVALGGIGDEVTIGVINVLANPALEGVLSPAMAMELIERLSHE